MKNKEYSEVLKIIGIIPIVATEEVLKDSLCWKERLEFVAKNEVATVWIHINFNNYHSSDGDIKKVLMLEAIIKSIEWISKKPKIRFNLGKFKEDILYFSKEMGIVTQ
jgi:hypothetical protein